ncbi:MAG: hypothetical protein Q7R39_03405 [Dehalococcoidia bacterium]|nr:hypothetical protein [Dehalococcoidia bacterium]
MKLPVLSPSTVSLSLEGWTLRVLETRGRQVHLWATIPFNPSLIKDGVVVDAEGLGRVIRDTFKTARLSRRKVVFAVGLPQAMLRVITFPKVMGASPDKVVDREIRRQLPGIQENTFVSWQALDGGSTTQSRVYVLAVPQAPVLAFLGALKVGGIRPTSMDLRAMALARSVNRKDAILGNVEANSVDVVIVLDDIPVLMRSMYLGDGPVSSDMAQERFLSELSRSISFYNETNRANPLADDLPIYLTGDLASEPSLAPLVEQSIGHTVSLADPPFEFSPDFPVSQFMVNIGLALKEL